MLIRLLARLLLDLEWNPVSVDNLLRGASADGPRLLLDLEWNPVSVDNLLGAASAAGPD
jgi:hypothetical protein